MTDHVRSTRRRLDEGSSTPRAEDASHAEESALTCSLSSDELKLGMDIEPLFNDEVLSDVTLWLEAGEQSRSFKCHKVILAQQSTYFRALFTNGMQESQQSVVRLHTPAADLDSCEQVLRMLYDMRTKIPPEKVLTYMHIADFYGAAKLLVLLGKFLERHVTVSSNNCCAKLMEATALRCTQAQRHCVWVLLQDFEVATKQPSFLQLEQSILAEVLSRDDLDVAREELVVDGLLCWLQAQSDGGGAALDELLPLVRWPLLQMETLASVESRLPALRESSLFCGLLLEGFRFHSADALAREARRAQSPRRRELHMRSQRAAHAFAASCTCVHHELHMRSPRAALVHLMF